MTAQEILKQLEGLGQASIKKVLLKHDIPEPLYGVKVEELKKILKQVKANHALSLELYASGIYDARYLAGLVAEPGKMTKRELGTWATQANTHALRECTVAWVTAESRYGMELALQWIASADEGLASTGWATLGSLVAITPDSGLDIPVLEKLLQGIPATIHTSANRVRHTMNMYIICVGGYVTELNALAKDIARQTGKVTVNMGDTACKVPDAVAYIEKMESRGAPGKKKKGARC